MSLDDQITKFLAEADAQPGRSKLEPYAELIRELRQRRWTFRKIADALRERFAVTASPSTIHDFAKVRARHIKTEVQPVPSERSQTQAVSTATAKQRFFREDEAGAAHFGSLKKSSVP